MPFGLRHVISGILAGGIPGFRMVLCCFPHLCVWPCVCFVSPFFLCLVSCFGLAILGCDDTMLPSLHESTKELVASHRVSVFVFVLVLFLCFVLFWFCCVCLRCLLG